MNNIQQCTSVYRSLRQRCKGVVKSYRSDWRVDRRFIKSALNDKRNKKLPIVEFVHVATTTGTHMWLVHSVDLDTKKPYLFGQATPRKIMRDIADLLDSDRSFPALKRIHHYDGKQLRAINRSQAAAIFRKAAA